MIGKDTAVLLHLSICVLQGDLGPAKASARCARRTIGALDEHARAPRVRRRSSFPEDFAHVSLNRLWLRNSSAAISGSSGLRLRVLTERPADVVLAAGL